LSRFFLGEHPQTTALILAHLPTAVAAQLLEQLPDDMRADVLLRIASLGEIPPDVIARISSVIEQKLRGLGGPSREQRGGVRAVAELFNCLDRGVRSPALEKIESLAPETATAIRNLMFVFEDLVNVEESGIREIVNRADKKVLTVALKGTSEDIRNRYFNIEGDVGTLSAVITRWLRQNNRLTSPKFLIGESYGGFRAPRIAHELQKDVGVGLNGIMMLSPVLDFGWFSQPRHAPWVHAVRLPSYVAAATEGNTPTTTRPRAPEKVSANS